MKKIIDVSRVEDEAFALNLIYKTMAERPDQKVGNKGAIQITVRDKTFTLVRNADSYTVREGKSYQLDKRSEVDPMSQVKDGL